MTTMMAGVVRVAVMAAGVACAAPSASGQFGATPIVPSGSFHQSPPAPSASPLPSPTSLLRPATRPALVSTSPEPTYDEGTIERLRAALRAYAEIEAVGGWPALPADAVKLAPGSSGPEVAALRQRLAVSGDLHPGAGARDAYDDTLLAAIKHFQARHGLPETGAIGPQTLAALNVPAAERVRQLTASLERLSATSFSFGYRYVVVNIPAAFAEVVTSDQVDRRFIAVVGKVDRPSPTLTALIQGVNLNPTWTPPLSILKKDIIPKVRKDPGYLARMHMRLLDAQGDEIDPASVDWSADRAPSFTVREDPGVANSLGVVRIDMPNSYSVYMHDTPLKNLFRLDYRFHSSGCARIADVRELAAWLLQDNEGWGRREIDAGIATGTRIDIRLTHAIPVAWIYLTGWATRDGTVHFRNDIYHHDETPAKPFMVSLPTPVAVSAADPSGYSLQSAESRPVGFKEVSYLDSQ